MDEIETTRISSRGQIVLPKHLRDRLHLQTGDILAIYGEGDTVVLKRFKAPSLEELKELHTRMKRAARKRGITPSDVDRAIARHRQEGT